MAGGRLWEPWEIAEIRTLPDGGIAELAKRLGRTSRAIQGKRHKLGFSPRVPRWSAAEIAELHAHVAAGGALGEAARRLGRSYGSAGARRHRERAAGRPVPVAAIRPGRGYRGWRERRGSP